MTNSKFILLNTHNSGTRLLLGSLNGQAQVKCYKNAFDQTIILERFAFDRLSSPFFKFRSTSLKRQVDYFFAKKQLIADFLQHIYQPANNGVAAVGIRLLYEQADKYPEILDWAVENNVAIIHLMRRNPLKTIVYTEASFKRGLLHSTSRAEPVTTLHLSPARLKTQLSKLTRQIEKYQKRLGQTRYLEVSYESLITDHEAETHRVLDFLGINQTTSTAAGSTSIAAEPLRNLLENYDEIKEALSGTAFEKFLTEPAEL